MVKMAPLSFGGGSKFHAQRTVMDGITFASKREADRYQDLRLLERAGEIRGLQCQVPYVLEINGVKLGKYIADFVYMESRGSAKAWITIVEDCKGVKTPLYMLKSKLMLALHAIEIRET